MMTVQSEEGIAPRITPKYGDYPRSDACTTTNLCGGLISAVDEDSPAKRAGLKPGMLIINADGHRLHDIIDWLWFTDAQSIQLSVALGQEKLNASPSTIKNDSASAYAAACSKGSPKISSIPNMQTVTLDRKYNESWGISFADPIFDSIMTCRNSCLFCFMAMLPKGMRSSLYLRDDDFRLSFLQGNFVTLTNMSDENIERVIEQHVSPLHVSLHAIMPSIREKLMGKNHARGVEALKRLLKSGIEFHAQIVLVPRINDGAQLDATLNWIEAQAGILSVGIVPYGYTKYAKLQVSYTKDEAKALIRQIAPYQKRAQKTGVGTRFQLADEWYLLADEPLPSSIAYDDYPQFEDGIGMLRSYIDDWEQASANASSSKAASKTTGSNKTAPFYLITGEAFAPTFTRLTDSLPLTVLPIKNNFFGGNVDVAGLLTAFDITQQVSKIKLPKNAVLGLPDVMFNADKLTLDDYSLEDISQTLKLRVIMIPSSAIMFLESFHNC